MPSEPSSRGPLQTMTRVAFAPGRIEWLGNHTDHEEGLVLAATLPLGVTVEGTPREDGRARIRADELGEHVDVDMGNADLVTLPGWAHYALGVARERVESGAPAVGFDARIHATLPVGCGLGSSGALTVAVARFLDQLSPSGMDAVELARLCQRVEHRHAGVACGLLDQLVAATGDPGQALLADFRTLQTEPVPVPSEGALVVLDSGARHDLEDSPYNARRASCRRAAAELGVGALRDVTPLELVAARQQLDPEDWWRASHVVAENARVQQAVEYLRAGDCAAVGRLMLESHESSRTLFENSTREIDRLVERASLAPGAWGARLTGAGWGGAVVCWVEARRRQEFLAALQSTGARVLYS